MSQDFEIMEEEIDDGYSMVDQENLLDDKKLLRELSNVELTRELIKEQKSYTNDMLECAREHEETRKVGMYMWKGSKRNLNITKDDKDLTPDEKEDIIYNMFHNCEVFMNLFSEGKILFLGNESPLNWIHNWKISKKIIIKRRTIQLNDGKGLIGFRNFVSKQLAESNIDEVNIKEAEEKGLDPAFIVPPTRAYLESNKRFFEDEYYSDENMYGLGEVIVEVGEPTLNEISNLFEKLTVQEKNYNVEDLVNDIQTKLKTKMNYDQKTKLKRAINTGKERNIINLIKNTGVKNLNNYTEDYNNPLGIGIKKSDEGGLRIISSKYPDKVKFLSPYMDPHFTFLASKIEYWVPKVHMLTGLQVYKEKKEVFKHLKVGQAVYLKLQSVKVKDNQEEKEIYYFRKFLVFEDFLRSWQETYVRQYAEIIEKVKNLLVEIKNSKEYQIVRKIKVLIVRKEYLRKKIKDIRLYFLNEIKEYPNPTLQIEKDLVAKMAIFAEDKIVKSIINKNIEFEKEVFNTLINIYEPIQTIKSDNFIKELKETILELVELYPLLKQPEHNKLEVLKGKKRKWGR